MQTWKCCESKVCSLVVQIFHGFSCASAAFRQARLYFNGVDAVYVYCTIVDGVLNDSSNFTR